MVKAVFTTKVDPTYDDLPEERYHFPRTYLRQVEATVGDWIIYYEPRRTSGDPGSRGGRQSYFATARVNSIRRDVTLPDHFYAYVTDYLEFDRAVPFKEGTHYFEAGLRREDGATSKGAFGRAVRPVSDREYEAILRAGFAQILEPDLKRSVPIGSGFGEDQVPFVSSGEPLGIAHPGDEPAFFERPVIERMVARPFRDAAFAAAVKQAYDNTCAITGLKIINGGGRAEVQAAHIRPVASSGPDSIRNGLALCGTVHWMFDRGLLSIDDDYRILIAKEKVPDPVRRLINPEGRLLAPDRLDLRPHRQFLKYHRDNVFKG